MKISEVRDTICSEQKFDLLSSKSDAFKTGWERCLKALGVIKEMDTVWNVRCAEDYEGRMIARHDYPRVYTGGGRMTKGQVYPDGILIVMK